MCPVCNTTLDQSSSPMARRIKAFIASGSPRATRRTRSRTSLVAEYGPSILAAPPKKGFNLLAWLLPFVGAVRRRARPRPRSPGAGAARGAAGRRPLSSIPRSSAASTKSSPATTRADLWAARSPQPSSRAHLVHHALRPAARAGLPLGRLGDRGRPAGTPGSARRVALASLPFIVGFTVVFVVLGIAAARDRGVLPSDRLIELAGLILVVFGLTFIGLLPWPERLLAPGLLVGSAPARLEHPARRSLRRSAPRPASARCSPRSSSLAGIPARS